MTASGYQQLCFGVTTAGGAQITVQNFGSAPAQGISYLINGAAATGQVFVTLPTTANDSACFSNTTGTLVDCGISAGNVVGPASATNGHIAVFSGATGRIIKDGGTSGAGNVTGPNSSIVGDFATYGNTGGTTLTDYGSVILPANGGTGLATLTAHAVQIGNGTSNVTQLAVGATGTLLAGTTGADPGFTATPQLGASGTLGSLTFGNATSGLLTLQTVTGALGTVTLGLPAVTDTLVARTTTDTLTNKTLTSPILTTPTLGVATATSINGLTITTTTGTLTVTNGKTLAASNSITLAGTDGKTLTASNSGTLAGGDGFTLAIAASKTLTVSNSLTFTGTDGQSFAFPNGSDTVATLAAIQTFTAAKTFASGKLILAGSGSGSLTVNCAAACGSNTLTLPAGTTDFSATGGTSQVVKQVSSGGAFTVAQLACADLSDAAAGCSNAAANPTASIGLSAVNGSAATYMRSDAAPALSVSIAPSWTGQHTWNVASTVSSASGAALDDIKVQAATTTVTGTATTTKLAKVGIYQPTITDASSAVVTDAATLYVDNAPLAAGSLTITNPWAIMVNAGASKLQATTINGLATLTSNIKLPNAGLIYPASDSTTALAIAQSDGATRFVTFDSSNKRVGINKTPGAFDLDVNGAVNVGGTLTFATLSATSLGASPSTVTGLTVNNSPSSANDYIPYYSASAGAIVKATVGSIAAGATAGVASLNGLTGGLSVVGGTNMQVTASGSSVTVNTPPPYGFQNCTLAAGVSGGALTVNIKDNTGADPSASSPCVIWFRSSTAATGSWVTRVITSAVSFATGASGSSFGSTNTSATCQAASSCPFRLWVVAIDNGSTGVLGVVDLSNASGVLPLNETGLPTTTACNACTNAATLGTIYSTATQTSKPIQILGYLEWGSGLGTVGTYASGPTIVQTMGPGVRKPGEIVQQQFGTIITSSSSNATTSYVDTTTVASITPTSAVNLVLANAIGPMGVSNASGACYYIIARSTTAISIEQLVYSAGGQVLAAGSILGLDTPNATSSTTYKVRQKSSTAATTCTYPSTSAGGSSQLNVQELMGALPSPIPANDNETLRTVG